MDANGFWQTSLARRDFCWMAISYINEDLASYAVRVKEMFASRGWLATDISLLNGITLKPRTNEGLSRALMDLDVFEHSGQ